MKCNCTGNMNKITLILTILYSIITVDCLQCYVCNDCSTVNDTLLVTCGGTVISTTTLPTSLTTSIPSNNNTTSLLNTTVATNPSTSGTTAQTLTTTTAVTPTPSVIQANATSADNNTNHNDTGKTLSGSRTRREILEEKFQSILPVYDKASNSTNTTLVYYCYKGTLKVNTKKKIVRGCASRPEASNKTICNDMATDPMVTECRTCTTDKCNSAFATRISLLVLIITAVPLSLY